MRKVVYKGLVPVLACLVAVLMSVTQVEAAYKFNWDFSSPKEEEYDDLIEAGYKEVSLSEAEKMGRQYYEKRNRYSGEVRIFCEGALSSELEELYTTHVNCFDSYEEAAMSAYIEYDKGRYYSSYLFGVEFSNFRQEGMTDNQYDIAVNKAEQLAGQFNYGTTKDKVQRAYDWVCNNMEYDDSLTRGSIYDAFVLGDTVCTGYATSFQLIMEKMGIESYLCTGYVDGENHAWNAVNVDGTYYFVDATFGDTSGNLDKWIFFGTDRRANETSLNIHSTSEYTDAEEMLYIIVGLAVVIGIPLIIIVVIIIICLKADSKRRKKNMANNPYYNQGYGQTPYGMPNQYGGAMYGGAQYGSSQYGGAQYGGTQYGAAPQYGGTQYGGGSYGTAYNNTYNNPYSAPNSGMYGGQQYGNTQYGTSQYSGTQYGTTQQYGNQQYGGTQYNNATQQYSTTQQYESQQYGTQSSEESGTQISQDNTTDSTNTDVLS